MLLIPQINNNDDLFLDAYSFNSEEISSVGFILNKSDINIYNEGLKEDEKGRYGLRFIISKFDVQKLERTLNLRFSGRGISTKVILNSNIQGLNSYRCIRIDTPPNHCETIYADDENEAAVKCALIASSNNWLGGVPRPGRC